MAKKMKRRKIGRHVKYVSILIDGNTMRHLGKTTFTKRAAERMVPDLMNRGYSVAFEPLEDYEYSRYRS